MNAAAAEKNLYLPFDYVEQVEALKLKADSLRGIFEGFAIQFVDKAPELCAMEVQNRYPCYSATAGVICDLIHDLRQLAQEIDNRTQIAAREGAQADE